MSSLVFSSRIPYNHIKYNLPHSISLPKPIHIAHKSNLQFVDADFIFQYSPYLLELGEICYTSEVVKQFVIHQSRIKVLVNSFVGSLENNDPIAQNDMLDLSILHRENVHDEPTSKAMNGIDRNLAYPLQLNT